MTVAVTGGSGVVGQAVVRHLLEAGRSVRALSRSASTADVMTALGVTPVRGDLADYQSLVGAFTGCRVVYHVAGLNRMCPRRPDELLAVNVDGTRNVVRAARAAGVERVVYTSSAAAIGEAAGTVGHEGSRHRGYYLSHYERSKHLAEQVVLAEAADLTVLLNPASVQGPGRATGTGKAILDLARGKLPVLVRTRFSVVDIDDCARAHLLAEKAGKPGERYILSGFTMSIEEAATLLESVLDKTIRARYLPRWMALGGGLMVEGLARLTGRQPRFCREMVRTLLHGHAYDGTKASMELGFQYTPAESTIRRTLAWFAAEGLLEITNPA